MFLYSTKDTIRDLKERPPRWQESALYAAAASGQLLYHALAFRSPLLTLLPYCVYGACFSTITQWSHVQEECFEEQVRNLWEEGEERVVIFHTQSLESWSEEDVSMEYFLTI